jgi:hypothetical protein
MSITSDEYRSMALALPEAIESSHLGTVDFRVRGKIFATLSDKTERAVLKLTPEQQAMLTDAEPVIFSSVGGAWGGYGWTYLNFTAADPITARSALAMAWRNVAPKKLQLIAE